MLSTPLLPLPWPSNLPSPSPLPSPFDPALCHPCTHVFDQSGQHRNDFRLDLLKGQGEGRGEGKGKGKFEGQGQGKGKKALNREG